MAVNIDSSCIGCEICISTCPENALYMGDDGLAHVNADKCTSCGECVEVCPVGAMSLPGVEAPAAKATAGEEQLNQKEAARELSGELAAYQGVWVFIEQREGSIAPVALELLGAGGKLAKKLGVELCGVLLGHGVENLVDIVYAHGADRVYLVDDPVLHQYRSEAYARVFVNLAREFKPEIILMGATTTGRDLAGAVATDLSTGLTADCTELDIDLEQCLLLATRPAFGGNIMATIVSRKHRPQMATVRPKVMRMPVAQEGRRGELVVRKVDFAEADLVTRVLEVVKDFGEKVNLQDAEIIVAGGRGLGDKESFESICFGLAEAIGGTVGASRAAVEAGWIGHDYQVGQTGVTVAPKIYLALGISGAVQHMVGIKGSEIVIAINNDPDAPIFKECTFGIVDDLFKVVPLLTEPLRKLLGVN